MVQPFNAAAYLAANPDVARAGVDPLQHYLQYGKSEGRQGFFGDSQISGNGNVGLFTATGSGAMPNMVQDESTFNSAAYLAANPDVARALGQPGVGSAWEHYQNYGKNEGRQATFVAPTSDNTPVDYKQQAADLGEQIYRAYGANENYDDLYYQLQDIKSKDPKAYYENQLKFLGQQVGWQIGQNTNERNAPTQAQIAQLIPQAQAAGLSSEEINSILGGAVNQANVENQQRIINTQQSGNYWTENLLGALKVGALAAGAYGLDTALAAGAAGSGGFGLTASQVPNVGASLGATGGTTAGSIGGFGSIVAPSLAGGLELGAGGGLLAGTGGLTAASIPSLTAGLEVGTGSALGGTTAGLFGNTTGTTGMYDTWGMSDELLAELGLEGTTSGLSTSGELGSATLEALGLNTSSGLEQFASLASKYGATAAKAILGTGASAAGSSLGNVLGGLLGGGTNLALTAAQKQAIQNAYNQQAATVQAAGQRAESLASFTPVGMTTAFGQSNFQFDPSTGKLVSAGYTPTSQVAGQVQNLFGLGAQALPTTTDTQAVQQQYIAQQQGLLAPSREQQLAQLQNRQYQRGTTGLATGGTMAGYTPNAQGLMATNPEMAAYYNAQAQQDAALAASAPTYAQNLLNAQIATGTGLFGAANTLEGYAQQPLTLSTDIGKIQAAAGANAGQLGLTGATKAADLTAQGALLANAAMQGTYNQLGQTAAGLGQNIGNYLSTNPTIQEWLK